MSLGNSDYRPFDWTNYPLHFLIFRTYVRGGSSIISDAEPGSLQGWIGSSQLRVITVVGSGGPEIP
jgi:hypothetical protein